MSQRMLVQRYDHDHTDTEPKMPKLLYIMCMLQDITAAYKKLARLFHPDKHQVCDQIWTCHVTMSHITEIFFSPGPREARQGRADVLKAEARTRGVD